MRWRRRDSAAALHVSRRGITRAFAATGVRAAAGRGHRRVANARAVGIPVVCSAGSGHRRGRSGSGRGHRRVAAGGGSQSLGRPPAFAARAAATTGAPAAGAATGGSQRAAGRSRSGGHRSSRSLGRRRRCVWGQSGVRVEGADLAAAARGWRADASGGDRALSVDVLRMQAAAEHEDVGGDGGGGAHRRRSRRALA